MSRETVAGRLRKRPCPEATTGVGAGDPWTGSPAGGERESWIEPAPIVRQKRIVGACDPI